MKKTYTLSKHQIKVLRTAKPFNPNQETLSCDAPETSVLGMGLVVMIEGPFFMRTKRGERILERVGS